MHVNLDPLSIFSLLLIWCFPFGTVWSVADEYVSSYRRLFVYVYYSHKFRSAAPRVLLNSCCLFVGWMYVCVSDFVHRINGYEGGTESRECQKKRLSSTNSTYFEEALSFYSA